MLYYGFYIAEGDCGFQAFLWKGWKIYPPNPVNPVKKSNIKIESIP